MSVDAVKSSCGKKMAIVSFLTAPSEGCLGLCALTLITREPWLRAGTRCLGCDGKAKVWISHHTEIRRHRQRVRHLSALFNQGVKAGQIPESCWSREGGPNTIPEFLVKQAQGQLVRGPDCLGPWSGLLQIGIRNE